MPSLREVLARFQPLGKQAGPVNAPLKGARGRFLPVDALQGRKDWGQLFPGMLWSKLPQGAPGFFSAGREMCLPLYPDFCCCCWLDKALLLLSRGSADLQLPHSAGPAEV